jgi:hypothetical protein
MCRDDPPDDGDCCINQSSACNAKHPGPANEDESTGLEMAACAASVNHRLGSLP